MGSNSGVLVYLGFLEARGWPIHLLIGVHLSLLPKCLALRNVSGRKAVPLACMAHLLNVEYLSWLRNCPAVWLVSAPKTVPLARRSKQRRESEPGFLPMSKDMEAIDAAPLMAVLGLSTDLVASRTGLVTLTGGEMVNQLPSMCLLWEFWLEGWVFVPSFTRRLQRKDRNALSFLFDFLVGGRFRES